LNRLHCSEWNEIREKSLTRRLKKRRMVGLNGCLLMRTTTSLKYPTHTVDLFQGLVSCNDTLLRQPLTSFIEVRHIGNVMRMLGYAPWYPVFPSNRLSLIQTKQESGQPSQFQAGDQANGTAPGMRYPQPQALPCFKVLVSHRAALSQRF
jgi:hypothetical protein